MSTQTHNLTHFHTHDYNPVRSSPSQSTERERERDDRSQPPHTTYNNPRDHSPRRGRCPRSVAISLLGSFSLLLTGVVLSIIGVYWVANKAQKHHGGVAFIFIGIVMILSGSYGAGEGIGRVMGWRGYDEVIDGYDDSDFEFARL